MSMTYLKIKISINKSSNVKLLFFIKKQEMCLLMFAVDENVVRTRILLQKNCQNCIQKYCEKRYKQEMRSFAYIKFHLINLSV